MKKLKQMLRPFSLKSGHSVLMPYVSWSFDTYPGSWWWQFFVLCSWQRLQPGLERDVWIWHRQPNSGDDPYCRAGWGHVWWPQLCGPGDIPSPLHQDRSVLVSERTVSSSLCHCVCILLILLFYVWVWGIDFIIERYVCVTRYVWDKTRITRIHNIPADKYIRSQMHTYTHKHPQVMVDLPNVMSSFPSFLIMPLYPLL